MTDAEIRYKISMIQVTDAEIRYKISMMQTRISVASKRPEIAKCMMESLGDFVSPEEAEEIRRYCKRERNYLC